MEPLKVVATLEKQICQLQAKQEKTHTQWLTKLKKQVEKGATQIKKLKERIKKAKSASLKKNIAMNLKANQEKQAGLKAELQKLANQHKKMMAQHKCLSDFEKGYQKLEAKKAKIKKVKPKKKAAQSKIITPIKSAPVESPSKLSDSATGKG